MSSTLQVSALYSWRPRYDYKARQADGNILKKQKTKTLCQANSSRSNRLMFLFHSVRHSLWLAHWKQSPRSLGYYARQAISLMGSQVLFGWGYGHLSSQRPPGKNKLSQSLEQPGSVRSQSMYEGGPEWFSLGWGQGHFNFIAYFSASEDFMSMMNPSSQCLSKDLKLKGVTWLAGVTQQENGALGG